MSKIENLYGCRCTWCNATNNREIAYNAEDYKPGIMIYIDPRDDTAFVCSECAQSVGDALSEFEEFIVEEKDEV